MKIGNSIVDDRDRLNLQEGLRKISQWSERWEMPFNVNKCHILHVGTRNQNLIMRWTALNSIACNESKILAFRLGQTLKSPGNARMPIPNRMLGFINRNFSFENKEIILPVYISSVRPHLEYAVQFWSPHHTKDTAILKAVQRRATKIPTK